MRLVHSSEIGAVERDQAARLLTERAILTRAVCRELAEIEQAERDPGADRRSVTALFLLLRWVSDTQSAHVRGEPRADDGLAQMIAPDGYVDLVAEIHAGAQVCNALFMLYTADTTPQADHDRAVIKTRLAAYWARCARPVPVPRRIG